MTSKTAHLTWRNNNKHFNDEALRINRMLKKENDALKEKLKNVLETLGVDYEEEDDGVKTVSKRHS